MQDLDLGEIIALGAVQRVDPTARARHRRWVDRARLHQLHLVPHAVLAQPAHAAQRPLDEDGALAHLHDQQLAACPLGLLDPHVVVLPRGVQRLDGPLDVGVAYGPAGDEPALLEHLLALQATEPEDPDRVGRNGRRRRSLALRARGTRGEHDRTHEDDEGALADHAFEPESARNPSRSLSGATSTSISSPRANSPTRIFSESGSSTYFWIARFSGRAPKCSSQPRSTRKSVPAGVNRSVSSSSPTRFCTSRSRIATIWVICSRVSGRNTMTSSRRLRNFGVR